MAAEENARMARKLNEAYNDRDLDAAVALTTADVVLVNVTTGQTFQGAEGVRQFLQGWASAFPDSRVETTNVIADERGASMEFTGRGTQTGPLQTPTGELPPTGRQVEVAFVQVLQFEQGKITHARLYFDALGMLQQLGVMPAPEQAGA
jgi:steroid delta-isomerase-like uncharacterized protein